MIHRFAWSLALLVALAGCGTLHGEYVAKDRATYDALNTRVRGWIDGDASMDDDKKKDYHGLMDSWDARLDAAEADLAAEKEADK